jgi:hypothetical protein
MLLQGMLNPRSIIYVMYFRRLLLTLAANIVWRPLMLFVAVMRRKSYSIYQQKYQE